MRKSTPEIEMRRAARLSGLARSLEAEFNAARADSSSIEHVLAQLANDEPTEEVRAALDDVLGLAAPVRTARPAIESSQTVPAGMRV